jgi:geranylgeranyl transferase type-2 subunit alpha
VGLSCHITCAHVFVANDHELILSISTYQALKVSNQTLIVAVNGVARDCLWESPGDPAGWPSSFWSAAVTVPKSANWPLSIEIQKDDQNLVLSVSDSVCKEAWCFDTKVTDRNLSQLTAATSKVLEEELKSCQQLVEIEPDNKWVLLTTVFLMQCLDVELHHSAILSNLDKLKAIDPYRQGYFNELKSYFIVERHTWSFQQQLAMPDKPEERKLSLSNMGLGRLIGTHQLLLVTYLDISHNQLRDLKGCQYLQCLEHLNADDNRLEMIGCSLDHLRKLTWLSLCNNCLVSMTSLDGLLGLNVAALLLQGNALLDSDVKVQLREIFPNTRFE